MTTLRSRSQRSSLNDIGAARALINIKYSNIPLNVPVLYPSSIKRKEGTLECFGNKLVREMIESDPGKNRGKYAEIRKNDQQDAIEVIIKGTKNAMKQTTAKKKKGSMYISELWANKHLKGIIKSSKLDRAYETIRKVEQEGLKDKLDKLEKAYQKREFTLTEVDSSKIFEEFMTGGLNSPLLTLHRTGTAKEERGRSLSGFGRDMKDSSPDDDTESLRQVRPITSKFAATTANLLKRIHSPDSVRKSRFYQGSFTEHTESEKTPREITCESGRKSIQASLKSIFYSRNLESKTTLENEVRKTSIERENEIKTKRSFKISSISKIKELNKSLEPSATLSSLTSRIKAEDSMTTLPTQSGSLSGNRNLETSTQGTFKPRLLKMKTASTRVLKKTSDTIR